MMQNDLIGIKRKQLSSISRILSKFLHQSMHYHDARTILSSCVLLCLLITDNRASNSYLLGSCQLAKLLLLIFATRKVFMLLLLKQGLEEKIFSVVGSSVQLNG